jgi:hypothetical protein
MGLDMYLSAKRHFYSDSEPAAEIKKTFPDLPSHMQVKDITVSVMYWRKANAIHKWFVDKVQGGVDDCSEFEVSLEQLEQLLAVIDTVLDNPNLAGELLPPQVGFFFGGSEVDDWYLAQLQTTQSELQELFTRDWKSWDFYYRASW